MDFLLVFLQLATHRASALVPLASKRYLPKAGCFQSPALKGFLGETIPVLDQETPPPSLSLTKSLVSDCCGAYCFIWGAL